MAGDRREWECGALALWQLEGLPDGEEERRRGATCTRICTWLEHALRVRASGGRSCHSRAFSGTALIAQCRVLLYVRRYNRYVQYASRAMLSLSRIANCEFGVRSSTPRTLLMSPLPPSFRKGRGGDESRTWAPSQLPLQHAHARRQWYWCPSFPLLSRRLTHRRIGIGIVVSSTSECPDACPCPCPCLAQAELRVEAAICFGFIAHDGDSAGAGTRVLGGRSRAECRRSLVLARSWE